jgi:hypothetical protein
LTCFFETANDLAAKGGHLAISQLIFAETRNIDSASQMDVFSDNHTTFPVDVFTSGNDYECVKPRFLGIK